MVLDTSLTSSSPQAVLYPVTMTTPPRPLTRRRLLSTAATGLLLTACGDRSTEGSPRQLRLATGPEGAVYREIGGAIAALINDAWDAVHIALEYTDAGWENVGLLREGAVELALTNIDIAQSEPHEALALGRLFDSVYHVVASRESGIVSFEDLEGLRVACGKRLSGTRFLSQRLFETAGISAEFVDASQTESMRMLSAGDVAAAISLTGMPTPAFLSAGDPSQYRLIDLGDLVPRIQHSYPLDYLPVTVPDSMYPGLGSAGTLAVPTLLLADTRAVDRDTAYRITDLVFSHGTELSEAHPGAGQINSRTGSATVPVDLHPGARQWFHTVKP